MSNFPSIPLDQKTEKNVKLFLDGLAGRMGIEGRAVTFQDLFDSGIIQLKPGITINDIQPGTNPGDVVDVPTGELPDNPTTPINLGASSSWGAVFLDWDYAAYNDEYGTEIWRSLVNDRTVADLIAVATGRTYKDIIGALEVNYFYWVRNRSASNTVSGYNQLPGVAGGSNLKTSVADFVMARPDVLEEFLPFAIESFSNDVNGDPIWTMLLNADVLVAGDLAIGQLVTGEMPEGVEFTIGNGSIQMVTDTGSGNALGSIIVTGNGGIAGNDYLRISNSAVVSQVWDESQGKHVDYKELKRLERGITQNGVQTTIEPYFKEVPKVYLSFEDITVYNKDHATQNQTLVMNVGPVLPASPFDGSWYFTPTATLVISDGIETQPEPYNVYLVNNDNGSYTSLHTFTGAEGVSVIFTVGSTKFTASGDYQNRRITVYVDGELNGVGGYNQIGTGFADLKGDGTDIQLTVAIPALTSGDWKFQYRFVAADRTGTTPGTGIIYEYADDNSNQGDLVNLLTDTIDIQKSADIINYRPTRGAEWNLYAVDYSFDYGWLVEAWCVKLTFGTIHPTEAGAAEVSIPGESGGKDVRASSCINLGDVADCGSFPPVSAGTYVSNSGNGNGGTNGKITITENDPLYLAGKYTPSQMTANGSHNGEYCPAGTYKGTGKANIVITGYNVSYYYRKVVAQNLDRTNHFQVNSVTANLGAVDISINNSTINWLAAGE